MTNSNDGQSSQPTTSGLSKEELLRICSRLDLQACPISCTNCKHKKRESNENPCLHCFDKVSGAKKDNEKFRQTHGRTPAYMNFTPMLSNVTREQIIEAHNFALRYYKDQGKSAWELNKEKFDDSLIES